MDCGFQIGVQNFLSQPQDSNSPVFLAKLSMPFNCKHVQIESMTVSRDGNNLISVAKTKETAFADFAFHLIIHQIGRSFKVLSHSVLPGVTQAWDYARQSERGEAVKVVEHVAQQDLSASNSLQASQTQIFTVLNQQGAEGGFTLLVWNFDRLLQ